MAVGKTLYEVLQITEDADAADIIEAYQRLRQTLDPEVAGNPQDDAARLRYKSIREAYSTLSNPARRRQYDASLAAIDDETPAALSWSPKYAIFLLLGCLLAYGGYWKYRSSQAAVEARLLEEKARTVKMEAEIERLKSELAAREDSGRMRMLEQQQDAVARQQSRELDRNRDLAEQVTSQNEAERARYERQQERQQEYERLRLEAQRRAEDMQARRQALESEADARRRAAQDANTIQALETERLNARRQQEQNALRQQQQAQQDALRRQQQLDSDMQQRRRMLQQSY
jgi:curved DNA-binding protein CbpA